MEKKLDILFKMALKAYKNGDIPVSAIIVKNDKIVAVGYNNRHKKGIVTGHAEINAVINAEKKIKDHRLNGFYMISTLKPCKMCYSVIEASRLDKVYYILDQESNYSYPQGIFERLNVSDELFLTKYKELFDDFFKKMR